MDYAKTTADRIIAHQLSTVAQTVLAFREKPLNGDINDALVKNCTAAANALVELDARATEIVAAAAVPLPPLDLRNALATLHVRCQASLAKANAATVAAADKLARDTAALEVPAPVSSVSDVLLDIETRATFAAADQAALLERMGKGELRQTLAALARHELGPQVAKDLYRQCARNDHPATVAALADDGERVVWAQGVCDAVAAILDQAVAVVGPSTAIEPPAPALRAA